MSPDVSTTSPALVNRAAGGSHEARATMTYLEPDGDAARQVEVQMDDGLWVPGSLEAFRKVEGVWSGFVRYSLAAGATQSGWFEEGRVRGHVD